MKTLTAMLLATSMIGLTSGTAFATCHDTTASIDSEAQAGIAKDGTHAPLETDATADAEGRVEGGPATKDGNTMPLANQEGGGNKNLATSQQDIEAQQEGEKTAAAEADANATSHDTTASVDSEPQAGIAKDGTHAPLETDATAEAEGRVEGGPATKDGNTMPLANQEGGGNKNLATSQQDIEAQQQGGQTAAAEAEVNVTDDPCKD